MLKSVKKKIHPKADENGDYLFSEINNPAFEEAITLATERIMAGSSDLSKAVPGEQLEYLTPGEKAPGDTSIHTTPRGARGYYPSEVVGGEEETEEPSELEPEEEREIQVVSPEPLSEEDQQPLSEEDQRRQDYHEMEGTLQKFNEEGKGYVKRLLAGTQFEYLKESERSLQTAEDVINWATDGIMQPMDYFEQLMELMDVIPIQDLEPFYDALSEMAAEAEEHTFHGNQGRIDNTNTPSAIINAEYNLKRQYAYFVENLLPRLQALPKGNDNPLIRKILVDAVQGTRLPKQEIPEGKTDAPTPFVSALIQMAPLSLLQEWYEYRQAPRLSTSEVYLQGRITQLGGKQTISLLDNTKVKAMAKTRFNRLAYFPDGAITQFQERASRIDDLKEDERLLPSLEDWPKKFQNLMKDIWRKQDPSTLMVKLIDELYKSTPYGLFHVESKREWEEGSSEPLAGVLKESASRILDGPIVFHNEMVGDEHSAEMIHAGIESVYEVYQNHFPSKEFVDQYLKVQKQVTYELLDMAFPDIDDFELFRGLGHRDVSKELEYLARDQAEWDKASREEEEVDADEDLRQQLEDLNFGNADAPVPDFDKLFSNVSGLFDENPLTSWSLDYHAASANFARGKGDDGVVLRRRVSKKDIWSSFMTHAYDGNELEMIVIPHKDNFTLGARYRDGEHSIGLERGEDTYNVDERVSNRGLVISNRFSPRSLEGSEYREHLRIIEAEKKDLEGIDKAEKDEQESKKPIIIDDAENADWIKEVRKKLEEKKTNNLSKLLVLETALEYFIKAEAGERLEYLSPGEKAPGDTRIHTTARGARGYYPSEVAGGEEETDALEPEEEREIEAVQAPAIDEEEEWKKWRQGDYDDEEPDTEEQREADEEYDEDFINKLLDLEDEDSDEVHSVLDELFPEIDWNNVGSLDDIELDEIADWNVFQANVKVARPITAKESEAIAFEKEKEAQISRQAFRNVGVESEVSETDTPRRLVLADVMEGEEVGDEIEMRLKYEQVTLERGLSKKKQQTLSTQKELLRLYEGSMQLVVETGNLVKAGDILVLEKDEIPIIANVDGEVHIKDFKVQKRIYPVDTSFRYRHKDGSTTGFEIKAGKDFKSAKATLIKWLEKEGNTELVAEMHQRPDEFYIEDWTMPGTWNRATDMVDGKGDYRSLEIKVVPDINSFTQKSAKKSQNPEKKELDEFYQVLKDAFDGLNTDSLFPNGRRYLSKHIFKLLSGLPGKYSMRPIIISPESEHSAAQLDDVKWSLRHNLPRELAPTYMAAYYMRDSQLITVLNINHMATGMDFNSFRKLSDWYGFHYLAAKDLGDGKAEVHFREPQYEGHRSEKLEEIAQTTGYVGDKVYKSVIDYKGLLTRHHGAVVLHEFGHRIDHMISSIDVPDLRYTAPKSREEVQARNIKIAGYDIYQEDPWSEEDEKGLEGGWSITGSDGFGKFLEIVFGIELDVTRRSKHDDADKISTYATENTREYLAEAWTAYMTDTFYLKARNPEVFEFFEALNTHDVATDEGKQDFFDALREKFPKSGDHTGRQKAAKMAKYLDDVVLSKEDAEKRDKSDIADNWNTMLENRYEPGPRIDSRWGGY